MKVLICGSRDYSDREQMRAVMQRELNTGDVVIHGAARGADTMGAYIAQALGLKTIPYPADWSRYGRSAGYRRNEQMINEAPDLVIAFFAGRRTAGTAHTVQLAQARGIRVIEVGLD